MKELSAHGSKKIITRVKKVARVTGYEVNGKHYDFPSLLAAVKAVNPRMTESLLRSRLKKGRRKWETLIGDKQ